MHTYVRNIWYHWLIDYSNSVWGNLFEALLCLRRHSRIFAFVQNLMTQFVDECIGIEQAKKGFISIFSNYNHIACSKNTSKSHIKIGTFFENVLVFHSKHKPHAHNDPIQNLLLSSIALLAKWIQACTVFAVLWKIKSVKIVAQSPQLLPTHDIFVFSRIYANMSVPADPKLLILTQNLSDPQNFDKHTAFNHK